MRALAEFIMRGRAQAIGVAVVGILLPFFLWFGAAAVGLVALRKGGNEAFIVLGWALLAALAALLWGGDIVPAAAVLATAIAALLLRWTSSWPLALVAVAAVGLGAALALNIFGSAYLDQLVGLLNELLEKLRAKHGPLMFHQSGGCCDGSSPMCYPLGEFLTGDSDVLLATIQYAEGAAEAPFYMSRSQFEYWKHTQLILDVVPGRGGMFSLENPEGVRFLIRSRVFTDDEIAALRGAGRI